MKKLVAGLGNAVQQAKKREEELKTALQAQNDRVISMKDARIELSAMMRDVDNAQRSYDAVLARYMTNKIESSAKSTMWRCSPRRWSRSRRRSRKSA